MLHKEASQAAKRFGPRRARRFTREIWEHMRWMDTPALDRAVEAAAAMLRAGGIQDVRIERLPADGKTCAGGWLMPLAWSVSSARLEIVGGSGAPIELVDHTRDPQAVAPWSPGTPRGRWVTGDVVSIASADARLPRDLSGRYVFLTEGRGCERLNARAAARGAAGILTTRHGQYPDASRFENAAVPKDPDTPCVPSYALSPRAGDVLQAALAHDKHLQIRGKVRARRYAGTVPLLTGSIGSGGPPIYVCGHIDEIGALDNASGCATGIEALCVLQKLMTVRGLQPQRRQIRFFFSTEIRGIQMWLNQQAQMPTFFGGINLDMTGADPIREPSTMQVLTGFQHRPHFSAHLLREAVSIADKCVGGMPWRERRNFVSDGMFGIHHLQGHVSLEQATGESYHTSADTPAVLSDRAFRWSGTATVAYLYLLSRLGSREALQLGRRIQDAVMQSGQKGAVQTTRLRRAQIELQTLMPALDDHNRPRGGLASVEAWYTAGVKRATGCWPDIERANDMRQMISEIGTRLARRTPLRLQAPAALQRRAQALVPAACFRGFLSFEDHVTSHARKRLQASTGLSVSWGTASWAWMLATCFRGKQSLLEIVNDLAVLGVTVPLDRAIGLTEHLESRGQIRLRPVITATALRRCLRALGVKRGSILVVHASLSDYGYMQGGSQMVIDTLRSILGPKGTLLMPTHSNSELGMPAYTPRDSPSNTGAVTEYFRKLPGVKRSLHPTHSVAGIGPAVDALFETIRPTQPPLDREGFWGRLYDLDGYVLCLCKVRSATLFHAGERWTDVPQPAYIVHYHDGGGKRRAQAVPGAPWHDNYFPDLAQSLIARGVMTSTRLGESTMHLAPARAMADISVAVNRKNPAISLARDGACTCHYCTALKQNLATREGAEARRPRARTKPG